MGVLPYMPVHHMHSVLGLELKIVVNYTMCGCWVLSLGPLED